ncbi:MAG: asparagine synthase C-terminal domain-containing protein [Oscillospiraceae bacterium]|nr:asparagine synthase C-terminal domain-containing protein [Oscillospiraceae bacterium]
MNEPFVLLAAPEKAAALADGACLRPSPPMLLSPAERVYRDGALLCVFRGCIYRCDDASLPCASPEEYVLAAYRKYGDGFLDRFEGKFILALADAEANTLLLARDHFGGFPLYYCCGEDFFASGPLQQLADCGLVPKKLSTEGLCDYFSLRFIPAPDTIFEGIRSLMAGHMLKVRCENGRVVTEERCWWDVDCRSENMLQDYESARELLRETLLKATDERCFDGRNGVFLSGGIDSTIMTGAASTLLGHKIDSFTVGFREEAYDESPRAKIAAEAHHTDHHLYILDYNEALGELDKIIAGFDQPFADDSAVPTWVINRFAAEQGLVNVLTGDGSDQIFSGSSKYFIRHYVDKIMKFPKPLRALGKAAVFALPDSSASTRKMRKVMACVDMDPYHMRRRMLQLGLDEQGLTALLKGQVADFENDAVARLYAVKRDGTDELTNTLYVDLKVVADGAMMTKMGSMSRMAGIQTHMPFLSKELLTLAFRIPPQFKAQGTTGKVILKDAFRDVIPAELMTASKKGFMPPVADWFRGPLLENLRAALDAEKLEAMGIFDAAFVASLIDEHVSLRANRAVPLWALYVFSKWYDQSF